MHAPRQRERERDKDRQTDTHARTHTSVSGNAANSLLPPNTPEIGINQLIYQNFATCITKGDYILQKKKPQKTKKHTHTKNNAYPRTKNLANCEPSPPTPTQICLTATLQSCGCRENIFIFQICIIRFMIKFEDSI